MRIKPLILALVVTTTAHAQTTNAQQRADAAQRVLTMVTAQYSAGSATLDDVAAWASRWFQAKRDTGLTGPALVAVAQQWVDKLRALEQRVQMSVNAGAANSVDLDRAAFYRLEAEAVLAKLKPP
jgi:hypothetical protein